MAFFSVNFIIQKFCPCKKNDKYEVWKELGIYIGPQQEGILCSIEILFARLKQNLSVFCLANKLQIVAVVFFRPALIVLSCSLGTPLMNIYLVTTLFDTLYHSATEHSFPSYAGHGQFFIFKFKMQYFWQSLKSNKKLQFQTWSWIQGKDHTSLQY